MRTTAMTWLTLAGLIGVATVRAGTEPAPGESAAAAAIAAWQPALAASLPPDCELAAASFELPETVRVVLRPAPELAADPARVMALGAEVSNAAFAATVGTPVRRVMIEAVDPETGGVIPWSRLVSVPPPPRRAYERDDAGTTSRRESGAQAVVRRVGAPAGFLAGKSVYLNPGHGRTWGTSAGTDYWRWQRPYLNQIIEDLSNVEAVHGYLAAYLHNAGARVDSVRELDPNPEMVVVDDGDGAASGAYVETGPWGAGADPGFANGHVPYESGVNPFSLGGTRAATCATRATATATWTPDLPAAGFYNVYVSYAAGAGRATDARYVVRHTGGQTEFQVDQTRHGSTWVLLGRFHFDAGRDAARGSVALANGSAAGAAATVSADAVRFGGGRGVITRGAAGTSGMRRSDEDARYHIQFMGCPESEYEFDRWDEADGWWARLKYCGWQNEADEDACYVAWHSNAGGGSGTSSFLHTYEPGTDSESYRGFIHDEIIHDIRGGYDAAWQNRGKLSGEYGEANSSYCNDEMPVLLLEYAFHDHASKDSVYMRDPKFRRLVARAVYQGIAKYFADRDGIPVRLLPEPPARFRAETVAAGRVRLSWDESPVDADGIAGDPAQGYHVYHGLDGYGFDNGMAVAGLSIEIDGLDPADVHFFRVTAVNDGGESFATQTLAVRPAMDDATPRILLVDGFDKLDRELLVRELLDSNTVYRDFAERGNALDLAVRHARAIEAWGACTLDSADDEAVGAGEIALSDYDAVVWACGLQSERWAYDPADDAVFDSAQRAAIETYIAAGGAVAVSGADVAWDLHRSGDDAFLAQNFHVAWAADDAGSNDLIGLEGPWAAIGHPRVDDGAAGGAAVRAPDGIDTVGDATAVIAYDTTAQTVDPFETAVGRWGDPNDAPETVAAESSDFAIVSSPIFAGAGAGRLEYAWDENGYIRMENGTQLPILASSILSIRVHGDGSGTGFALAIRDLADDDLFLGPWVSVDWTGWQSVSWDPTNLPGTFWSGAGDGVLTGSTIGFDGFHLRYGGSDSGAIGVDEFQISRRTAWLPTAAAVGGPSGRSILMGFPFEAIVDSADGEAVMTAILDTLLSGAPTGDGLILY